MQARERGVEFVSIVDMRKNITDPAEAKTGAMRHCSSFLLVLLAIDVGGCGGPYYGPGYAGPGPYSGSQRPLLLPFKIDRTTRTALATTSGASITHGVPATGPAATPASGIQAITFW